MDEVLFRDLKESDLPQVLSIYTHYILNTTVTCQISPIDLDEIRSTVMPVSPRYKSYAIELAGNFCGYALFTRFKTREAFDNTAEVTIYLDQSVTGKGIGNKALSLIEDEAKKAGIHVLVALISSGNRPSTRIFEKNGYTQCAAFKEVSYKFGHYFDLLCFQKLI
jgi:L-amino acid N-acyltransferase YncA